MIAASIYHSKGVSVLLCLDPVIKPHRPPIEAASAKIGGRDGARPTVREDGGDFLRGLRTRYRRRSLARSVGPNWAPTVVARLFLLVGPPENDGGLDARCVVAARGGSKNRGRERYGSGGLGSSKLQVEYTQIISRDGRQGRQAGEGSDEVRARAKIVVCRYRIAASVAGMYV